MRKPHGEARLPRAALGGGGAVWFNIAAKRSRTVMETMTTLLTDAQIEAYRRDGYLSPIRVMSEAAAGKLRARLEAAEAAQGGRLEGGLRFKPHLLYAFLDGLVRNEAVLDAVEGALGPDILCWSSSFFTKEAHDPGFVSWHQDSTYWGLSEPDITTAWVALSPSTPENGCMRVIPGTHTLGQLPHFDTNAKDNMLSRGQVIDYQVDEARAVDVVLRPGEMSLHHVRLIHGSNPNPSGERRIGFAIRYIAPHVRQLNGPHDSAVLVRGEDRFHYYEPEPQPASDFDPAAVAAHARAAELHGALLYQGSERKPFS
jgi:non-heme Fe2+,alpha-ketoglutarate-dependent halogenase